MSGELKSDDVKGIEDVIEKELAKTAQGVGHKLPPDEDKPGHPESGTDWMGWTGYEDTSDFTCYGYPVPLRFFVMRCYYQDTRRDRALWDCRCGRWIARSESEVRAWTKGWRDCRKNMAGEVKAALLFSDIMKQVNEFGGKAIIQRLPASPITHGEPTGIGVFEIPKGPEECLRFIVDEVLDKQDNATINALDPRLGTVLQTAKLVLHDASIDEDALRDRIDAIVRNFEWAGRIGPFEQEKAKKMIEAQETTFVVAAVIVCVCGHHLPLTGLETEATCPTCGERWSYQPDGEGGAEWLRSNGREASVIPGTVRAGTPEEAKKAEMAGVPVVSVKLVGTSLPPRESESTKGEKS